MIGYYDPEWYHSVRKLDDNVHYCTLCNKLVKFSSHNFALLSVEGLISKHIATRKHQENYEEWKLYNHNLVTYVSG